MKSILQLLKFPLLGSAGFFVTPYIPEAELLVFLKYMLLGGLTGNLCTLMLKFCEWAKGDTKKLLESASLSGREQIRLAQAIQRRSTLLWIYNLLLCGFMGAGWILYLLHSNGYWKPYSVRLAMSFLCMTLPLFVTILLARRDYVTAKEKLDHRDAGVADVD